MLMAHSIWKPEKKALWLREVASTVGPLPTHTPNIPTLSLTLKATGRKVGEKFRTNFNTWWAIKLSPFFINSSKD